MVRIPSDLCRPADEQDLQSFFVKSNLEPIALRAKLAIVQVGNLDVSSSVVRYTIFLLFKSSNYLVCRLLPVCDLVGVYVVDLVVAS